MAVEDNLRLSFSYVKKDLMKLNEQIEIINEKIQHLSLNHAALLEQISKLQKSKQTRSKPKKTAKKSAKKVVKETTTYE